MSHRDIRTRGHGDTGTRRYGEIQNPKSKIQNSLHPSSFILHPFSVPLWFTLLFMVVLPVQPALAQSSATKFTLPTGVKVIVRQDTNSEVVAFCVFIRAGAAEEEGAAGVGALTARAIFGSNLNQSRESVNRAIYAAGGSMEALFSPDYTVFTCVTTREVFDDALYVIAQALKNPDFDADTLRQARREAMESAAKEAGDPFRAAYAALREEMYRDSPYRMAFGGTPEGLSRLTAANVRRFFERRYTPENTVISICGNITPESARRTVENLLLPDYDRPAARPVPPSPPEPLAESSRVIRRMPTNTTFLLVGFHAPALSDPDYPAFTVLNALLGGGKSSRLFRAVRDTAGVGYAVGTYFPPLARDGHMIAFVEFDPKRVDAAGKPLDESAVEKMMIEAAQSVLKTPPTPQEIERAKRYAIGTFALAHQRARDRAFYLGWYELMGVGFAFDTEFPNWLAHVTGDDVRRVAYKYLGRWITVVMQPQK
jgi:zinc protease